MHPDCVIHHDLEQGSEEWLAARNGLLTASEMHLILTPTLKLANNDKTRAHVYEIAAQRINKYTEPTYIGDAMLRGHDDEIKSRDLYSEKVQPVQELGFITRDMGGCVLGYSPDGAALLSESGIECKSRIQKHHLATVVNNEVPKEHIMQVQFGLLVTGWDYIDYLSWCGGMPMWRIECKPIPEYQDAILNAALAFDDNVNAVIEEYGNRMSEAGYVGETEREEVIGEIYA